MLPSDTAPEHDAEHDAHPAAGPEVPTESVSLGALSLPARLTVAVAVGAVAVYTVWHLAMVFLFVAPSNTLSEDYRDTVRGYIYPEFEQNWKLFAPNPLQRQEGLEVRAEVRGADGGTEITDWLDLGAIDVEGIRHNPLPSHTAQNLMRRAWDFYVGAHNEDGDPVGQRGELSASYVHRIALLRLGEETDLDLDAVERLQLRSSTTRVPAPDWRAENYDTDTYYEELDWWAVTAEDLPRGALAQDDEGEQP
ncbi:DUF5819 family protein [Streptomyces sp. NBC_01803]|uniref:DUF5819 family protein n=1 Tax=Streptomyces sp. NBC_01803 TaxID=2975946 RepID=UPI002DDA7079|nr:DUF5819 family protein [Streptomyces sp. NBC_01803]WSA45241.1 DUF5819 family protein [Streptomyces sp. NBC_01803]